MNCIIFTDCHGNIVNIPEKQILDYIDTNSRVKGMDINVIIALRQAYLDSGGELPVTVEKIKRLFTP